MKQNIEQLEAHQLEADRENKKNYETLSKKDKKKIDAVNVAIKTLTDAEVNMVMFCMIPNFRSEVWMKEISTVQYNNWLEISNKKFHDIQNNEESIKKNTLVHTGLALSMLGFIKGCAELVFSNHRDKIWQEKILNYFYHFNGEAQKIKEKWKNENQDK